MRIAVENAQTKNVEKNVELKFTAVGRRRPVTAFAGTR